MLLLDKSRPGAAAPRLAARRVLRRRRVRGLVAAHGRRRGRRRHGRGDGRRRGQSSDLAAGQAGVRGAPGRGAASTTRRTSGCSTRRGAWTCPSRPPICSHALVEEAVSVGSLVRLLQFEGGQARLVEVTLADNSPAGHTIAELQIPRDAVVVAVVRAGHVVVLAVTRRSPSATRSSRSSLPSPRMRSGRCSSARRPPGTSRLSGADAPRCGYDPRESVGRTRPPREKADRRWRTNRTPRRRVITSRRRRSSSRSLVRSPSPSRSSRSAPIYGPRTSR